MSEKHRNQNPKSLLTLLFKKLAISTRGVGYLSLSTADGFCIHSLDVNNVGFDDLKVAAIASSICALGDASMNEMSGEDVGLISVEAGVKTMMFLSTRYCGSDCVLSFVVNSDASFGESRYLARRLATAISNL